MLSPIFHPFCCGNQESLQMEALTEAFGPCTPANCSTSSRTFLPVPTCHAPDCFQEDHDGKGLEI